MSLRLIFYSTAPNVGVGYGVLTKQLVDRMKADGHFIKIATKHHIGNYTSIDGVDVFDGMDPGLVNLVAEDENFDYIFTAMDVWTLERNQFFKKWVAINFLDVEYIFPKMIENLKAAQYVIAITEHEKRELERTGFKPFYAPLGTDTKLFIPDDTLRKATREKRKWDDNTFVVGFVGLNYATDRKNIIGLIKAFQTFHERHPNTKLYLHTDVMGNTCPGLPLKWIISSCGFPDDSKGPVEFANEKEYHLWRIPQEEVADLYRAFDVFCIPSHGEGFGFPWLEAQSSGCPAITVDSTSGRQLNFGGYIIPAKDDYFKFSTHMSWFFEAPPSAIDEQLELAYQDWANPDKNVYKKRQEDARKGALEYDWDLVYDKYWRPILAKLGDKTIPIPRTPNYGTDVYENFTGQALMLPCWQACGNEGCKKVKPDGYPLLPGEWKGPAPVLQRSYPVVPDKNGKLLVDTSCSLYKWLSARFYNECKYYWEVMWGYPLVRDEIKKLWDSGYFNGKYAAVDEMPKYPSFDEGYIKAWQTQCWTTFEFKPEMLAVLPKGGSVLDVGAGDGKRVQYLKDLGFNAMGAEVNPEWIKASCGSIVYGDSMDLPFKDNSFDMVLSVDVLEHMDDPIKAMSELFRVAKDYVMLIVTPTESKEYFEDPTHRVPWNRARWRVEIMEFAESITEFKNAAFLIKKRKSNEDKPKVS
jgi:glycosyltransferase involved in cell wall biosynthesis/SAM-dependent methyltransferase